MKSTTILPIRPETAKLDFGTMSPKTILIDYKKVEMLRDLDRTFNLSDWVRKQIDKEFGHLWQD